MTIKQFFIGVLLFFIFYLEPLSFGPIKFAHLWKFFFLFLLLSKVHFVLVKNKITQYSIFYYFKYIVTTGVIAFGYWGDGLYMMIRGISIPVVNNYLLVKNLDIHKILKILNFVAVFCIISSIPFLLDLIQPISRGYVLEGYGEDENGFVGIFQNPHGAAIIISQALLIIFFNVTKAKRIKLFQLFIFLLGCFILYKTYVRTGYVMFFIGMLLIVRLEYGFKKLYKILPFVLILGFTINYLYMSDSVLQGRIKQENIYKTSETFDIDKISSGRLTLSMVNLENWIESDPFSLIFGLGFQYSTDLMLEDINMRKASHNGFVDALVHNGLIGFTFYILLLKAMYKEIRRAKKSEFYSLGIASFVSFLQFIILQGGNVFLLEIQLLLIIHLLRLTVLEKILPSETKVKSLNISVQ